MSSTTAWPKRLRAEPTNSGNRSKHACNRCKGCLGRFACSSLLRTPNTRLADSNLCLPTYNGLISSTEPLLAIFALNTLFNVLE
jgi:hypothetical protein